MKKIETEKNNEIKDSIAWDVLVLDQQKEIIRLRGLYENIKKKADDLEEKLYRCQRSERDFLSNVMKSRWKSADNDVPVSSEIVWVQSEGGVNCAAFFDGDFWWTPEHKKINVKFWQYLPLPVCE